MDSCWSVSRKKIEETDVRSENEDRRLWAHLGHSEIKRNSSKADTTLRPTLPFRAGLDTKAEAHVEVKSSASSGLYDGAI